MKRLVLRLAPLVGLAVLALVAPAGATGPFPDMLTTADRDRLSAYQPTRRATLDFVRRNAAAEELAVLEQVIEGSAVDLAPAQMAGEWRCRVLKLARDPHLPLVIYDDFRCRITDGVEGLRLVKLTGSQRTAGTFYDIGETRLGYAGALALGDEREAPRYGGRAERNQAGYLVPLSPTRMRLEFPSPPGEADFEILELRR